MGNSLAPAVSGSEVPRAKSYQEKFPLISGRLIKRYHALGGGYAGGQHLSTTAIADANNAPRIAGDGGAVTSTTDTGHADGTGEWARLPDTRLNATLWRDSSDRTIHEMAVKTKALA